MFHRAIIVTSVVRYACKMTLVFIDWKEAIIYGKPEKRTGVPG